MKINLYSSSKEHTQGVGISRSQTFSTRITGATTHRGITDAKKYSGVTETSTLHFPLSEIPMSEGNPSEEFEARRQRPLKNSQNLFEKKNEMGKKNSTLPTVFAAQ